MKARDLKQAKIYYVHFDDKKRPLTFDFNTLATIQENGFYQPIEAIVGVEKDHLRSLQVVVYSCLVSGHMAENEDTDFDMTLADVGRVLGYYLFHEREHYEEICSTIAEASYHFFPQPKKEDKKDDKGKDNEKKEGKEEKN